MNDYKSVRNRLFKNSEVDLKSESVELSVTTDLQKFLQEAKTLQGKAETDAKDVESRYQAVNKQNIKIASDVEKLREKARKVRRDADDKAKELGVKSPKEWEDTYTEIFKINIPTSNKGNIFPI